MKKQLLFSLMLSSVLFANEMLIKQDLSITTKVSPSTYFSNIQITGSDKLRQAKNLSLKDKNTIIQTYNTLNTFLQKSEICKGGSFDLTPFYEYKEGKKEQIGFESHYSLSCEFKEESAKDFNVILDFIQKEIQKNPHLLFSIPKINKSIKEEDLKALDNTLNQKLIQTAKTKAEEYSKTLNKKCWVKEITLNEDSQNNNPILYKAQAMAKSDSNALEDIIMPSAKEVEKEARGKVVFVCK